MTPTPTPTPVAGTLTGIRVVEIGSNIAGPLAAMILGDLGADVVKVEAPLSGDDTRSLAPMVDGESTVFRSFNRSKRSVALDLRTEAGRAAALRLASRADVVIQNLRPGVVERLGVGFDAVCAANDRVIYCSISAFGPGALGATMPGYDALVQAYSGIMDSTGHPGEGDGGGPVRVSASLVDISTGVWAALGILAALLRRPALSGPQYIEPALLDSAFALMAHQVTSSLLTGEVPERLGSGSPSFSPYQAYRARDEWVFVAAGSNRLFVKLCDLLGCPELAADARFAAPADRIAHRDVLNKELADRFREAPVGEWVARLGGAGIPACPVHDLPHALASPVTVERGLLVDGFLRLPVDTPTRPSFVPPPGLGAHSREILTEVGLAPEEIDSLLEPQEARTMTERIPAVTVAIIEPQPEEVSAVEEALRTAVQAAHSEAGCELYALHRADGEPLRFVMVEQWADADALAAHMAGDGIKALLPVLGGKLAGPPQILRLTALPEGDAKLGRLVP